MIHLRQPEGSGLCGQHCVAMLVGASIYDVIALMGTGSTNNTSQRAALWAFNWDMGRAQGFHQREGNLWIARYKNGPRGRRAVYGHVVVLSGDTVYDSCADGPMPLIDHMQQYYGEPHRAYSVYKVR